MVKLLFTGGNFMILKRVLVLPLSVRTVLVKPHLLKCLVQELEQPSEGIVKWSENASVGYCPQDSTIADFDNDHEHVRLDVTMAYS